MTPWRMVLTAPLVALLVATADARPPGAPPAAPAPASMPTTLVARAPRALPGGGHLVAYEQRAAGLRVVGGGVVERTDASGRVRWRAGKPLVLPVDFVTTPSLAAPAAVVRARTAPASIVAGDATSELLVWRGGPAATPLLAWRIELAGDARALVPAQIVLVDAHTGRLLGGWPLAAELDQAKVYEVSPAVTPTTTTVTLPLGAGLGQLANADFIGLGCIDDGSCVTVNVNGQPTSVHACGYLQRAAPDASGDYLYDPPMASADAEDAFAEVQIFWHSARALAFFRALGLTDLRQKPMRAVANVRVADYADLPGATCTGEPPVPVPGKPLLPLQNAAFFRAAVDGSFPTEDMMIFGQGTNIDFAYDGDVVYHELGHALHFAVAPDYGRSVQDARGLDLTPHGSYEAYADYFAMALTEDPELGEYAGLEFGYPAGAGLRTGLNTKRCPTDLWGEEHQDGEPWVGALWDVRTALSVGERPSFDAAVLTVLSALGAGATPINEQPAMLAAEVELRLGAPARALVEAKLAARGWDDCDDRVAPLAADAQKDVLLVRGTNYLKMDTLVPAVLQFRVEVPARAAAFTLAWQNVVQLTSLVPQVPVPPDVKLLVKKDGPLTWTWGAAGASHDADAVGDVAITLNAAGSATVTGDFAPGTYHVQLANHGGTVALLRFGITPVAAPPTPDAGPTVDAGGTGPGGDGDGAGCGCAAARRTPGPAPLAATLGLGLAFLSRLRSARARRRRAPLS